MTQKVVITGTNTSSQTDAYQIFKYDNSKSEELLKAGFGVVNTHIEDGLRKVQELWLLNNETKGIRLLANQISNHFSFQEYASNQAYPSSLMGMMALLRQMYFDLDWYKGNSKNKIYHWKP
jgi:hypothetical protein